MQRHATFCTHVGLSAILSLLVLSGCAFLSGCGGSPILYTIDDDLPSYDHVEVLVNGVPVRSFDGSWHIRSGFVCINWFLHSGENEIRVVATQPNGNERTSIVRVCQRPVDAEYQEATPIKEFRFGKKEAPGGEMVCTITANIAQKWSWQSAEKITAVTAADRDEIIGQIWSLYCAYARRNTKEVLALMREGLAEQSRSVYLEPSELEKELSDTCADLFSDPSWKAEDLDVDSFRITTYGNIVIVDRAGGPVIRGIRGNAKKSSGAEFVMNSLFVPRAAFVKSGGRWVFFSIM
jgi:hypothetical protein